MTNKRVRQRLKPANDLPCTHNIRPQMKNEPGFFDQPSQYCRLEGMTKKLPAISYSQLTDFISCRRKYYLGLVEGLQVKAEQLPQAVKLGPPRRTKNQKKRILNNP